MSSYGIVNTIQAPTLSSATQPDLIQFEVNFSAYTERIEDINAGLAASQRIKAASIRQCMKPKLLHSLCVLGRIEGAASSEDATDEAVQDWFNSRLASTVRDLSDRVEEAISGLKYKQIPRDPPGAAEQFVLDVIAALDEYNASSIIKDKNQCKELVVKLVPKLEPPELRQIVADQMQLWQEEEKGDLTFFANTISTLASQVHVVQCASSKLKRKHTQTIPVGGPTANPGEPERKKARRGTRAQNTGSGSRGTTDQNSKDRASSEKWTKPCLNKAKCSGVHPISQCPETTKEERRELLDLHFGRKRKNGKNPKASVLRSACQPTPNAEDGRYKILLNDIETVALGDSGADYSTIPSDFFSSICAKYFELTAEPLEKHMTLDTALKSDESLPPVTASRKVNLDLTIVLPQTGIPVRIRDEQFLIADTEMPEVLLGRPLLKAMGFDFNEHLHRVASLIDGKTEEELQGGPCRLSAATYQGLSYTDMDDDPIDPPECLQAGFGVDSAESITEAIESAVEEAKKNGLSDGGTRKLRGMLEKHRSCFRIKLGPDPQADVRPLAIKLAPNAKPYRSPQRRYSPAQRVFIKHTIRELGKIGAVYKNDQARWACPALAVPKPSTDKLRFTVDLRGTNAKTLPLQSAMPHLESMLRKQMFREY